MYQVIIIGGGPAGITAGIYLQRFGIKNLLIEKSMLGGQVSFAETIENYPGFERISGFELTENFKNQAEKYGLKVVNEEVIKVEFDKNGNKKVFTNQSSYQGQALVVATGAKFKKLGIEGEDEFIGKGISYCATCDGPLFSGKKVMVVGGGDSAITEALILSKMVGKVYVIHRRDQLRAQKFLQERAFENKKIEFIWNSILEKIIGKDFVESVVIKNVKSEAKREMAIDGIFIYIGIEPNTDFVNVDKDVNGFILTNQKMETSSGGIFAAGDCRSKIARQISISVGEGALAAIAAEKYLEKY